MGQEIERKFLVKGDAWREQAKGCNYRQGYLSTDKNRVVRVRTAGTKGYLTIKGLSSGAVRTEFEYEIPLQDANSMLSDLCEKPLIEKTRYKIDYHGLIWEIDEFSGENAGLVTAEVELASEHQKVDLPPWLATEVTSDQRYFNSNLIASPYKYWK